MACALTAAHGQPSASVSPRGGYLRRGLGSKSTSARARVSGMRRHLAAMPSQFAKVSQALTTDTSGMRAMPHLANSGTERDTHETAILGYTALNHAASDGANL